MQLHIDRDGTVRCLYGESIDLAALGQLAMRRASHVEPDECGHWWANLAPMGGPTLGPFCRRSEALLAEVCWLETAWLGLAARRQASGPYEPGRS